jgi:hypothetical protein
MIRAKYIGATNEQVAWGNCADPRGVLMQGCWYDVSRIEIRNQHTKLYLAEFPDTPFNSACFSESLQGKSIPAEMPRIANKRFKFFAILILATLLTMILWTSRGCYTPWAGECADGPCGIPETIGGCGGEVTGDR